MLSLYHVLKEAQQKKSAVGHFNISTLDVAWSIFLTAKKLDLPVVLGVSEGERDFMGIDHVASIVKNFREKYHYPIFLNADHTYSLERIKEVVAAGYDSVIFDGAKLTPAENLSQTKAVVAYVKSVRWEMLVEAEVGYIGTSSKLLDKLPDDISFDHLPTADVVINFVNQTGVDCISPAVGNIHGMLKNAPNPKLHIDLIQAISQGTPAPIVLHGGSGISDEDFTAAINAGVAMVHINTEIRAAWKNALRDSCATEEVAPYKLLQPAQEAVSEVVEKRLKLFANR